MDTSPVLQHQVPNRGKSIHMLIWIFACTAAFLLETIKSFFSHPGTKSLQINSQSRHHSFILQAILLNWGICLWKHLFSLINNKRVFFFCLDYQIKMELSLFFSEVKYKLSQVYQIGIGVSGYGGEKGREGSSSYKSLWYWVSNLNLKGFRARFLFRILVFILCVHKVLKKVKLWYQM